MESIEQMIKFSNLKALIRHDKTGKWAVTDGSDNKPFNMDKDFIYDSAEEAIQALYYKNKQK